MNERIQLILKTKNISASRFADEIGVQRSSISHIISGRNNPSLDFIQKILKRFPDINSDWLIFGKGIMYKEPDLFSTAEENKTDNGITSDQILPSQEDISDENTYGNIGNQDDKGNVELSLNPELPLTQIKKSKSGTEVLKNTQKPPSELKSQQRKIERIIIFYSDKTCTEYKID
jgi:transcriptional regulator with XRE-family HTH domain